MIPKVSVIMNSYHNKEAHLVTAVRSILEQVNVEVQLIVSTVADDSAVEIAIKEGAEVFVNENAGIYQQLNAALPLVDGDWFFYASGNDFYLPKKAIHEVRKCVSEGRKVCYSTYCRTDKDLNILNDVTFYPYSFRRHLIINFVSDVSLMHRSILDEYSPFNEEYDNYAFYDFWLRVAEGEGEDTFVYSPEPAWLYRISKESRHQKRLKDASQQQSDSILRQRMLLSHR